METVITCEMLVPPTRPHGLTTQKTVVFVFTAERTQNIRCSWLNLFLICYLIFLFFFKICARPKLWLMLFILFKIFIFFSLPFVRSELDIPNTEIRHSFHNSNKQLQGANKWCVSGRRWAEAIWPGNCFLTNRVTTLLK